LPIDWQLCRYAGRRREIRGSADVRPKPQARTSGMSNVQFFHFRLKRGSVETEQFSGATLVPSHFLQDFNNMQARGLAEVLRIVAQRMDLW